MRINNPFRSLENYIKKHPKAAGARSLTEARILAFGAKRSLHGLRGKTLSNDARSFWMGKGYNV